MLNENTALMRSITENVSWKRRVLDMHLLMHFHVDSMTTKACCGQVSDSCKVNRVSFLVKESRRL